MHAILIDIGNTRIKCAVVSGDIDEPAVEVVARGLVAAEPIAALQRVTGLWPSQVDAVAIACVAGSNTRQLIEDALQPLREGGAHVHWLRSQAEQAGVRNGYREPERLGVDRWLAMLAARARRPDQPLLVVCSGTCTTIDSVTADGQFIGGVILPGVDMMRRSLALQAAQLPITRVDQVAGIAFPDNTVDAIGAGVLRAQVGAVRATLEQLRKRSAPIMAPGDNSPLAPAEVNVIISGGAARLIHEALAEPAEIIPGLVLEGLWIALTERGRITA